ncbi:LAMI_0F05578g1_1 [Lachancea mirantina]|uniref:LAMI_0F05578g1_1 n=1 Tax=Lachancea mirantina TaxID=1230905 RepID=A0A1G4JYF5_9SACH|nr:LAMI_0F05578g1_1 [Lachancea mirantina]
MISNSAMGAVRRAVWATKASHPRLVRMELVAHQSTCHEYGVDVLKHLVAREHLSRASFTAFQAQPEINVHMRSLIFDFVMCCHTRLALSSSTLFLCFNILDRYCARIVVKSATYQLVALCALWLASKFTDKKPRVPSLRALQSLCCHQYSRPQFQQMELHILQALDWEACAAPPHDAFIDIFVKNKISSLCYKGLNLNDIKYAAVVLCELACFDPVLAFDYNASAVALAAVTIATHALQLTAGSPFSHYSEKVVDPNLRRVCDLLLLKFHSANFPSSFRLKYLGHAKVDANPILRSLSIYDRHVKPDEFLEGNAKFAACMDSLHNGSNRFSRFGIIPPTPSTPSSASVQGTAASRPGVMATPQSCVHSPVDIDAGAGATSASAPSTSTTNLTSATATRPAMFKREHAKRNSSIMDPSFFDGSAVSCKRMREQS